MPKPRAAILAVLITLALAACTSTNEATVSSSHEPSVLPASSTSPLAPATTPSASPSWTREQQAAVRAVEHFVAVASKLAKNPEGFTKAEMRRLLKEVIGRDLFMSNVAFYLSMKAKRYHQVGDGRLSSIEASPLSDNGRGDEVHVTVCRDLREISVVDKNGDPVADAAFRYPAFRLRQFSVRRPPGENAFRVFGVHTVTGVCGP